MAYGTTDVDHLDQREQQETTPRVRQPWVWEPPRRKIGGWSLVFSAVSVALFGWYVGHVGTGSMVTTGFIAAAAMTVLAGIAGLLVARWAFASQAAANVAQAAADRDERHRHEMHARDERHRQDMADMAVRHARAVTALTTSVDALTDQLVRLMTHEEATGEQSAKARENVARILDFLAKHDLDLGEIKSAINSGLDAERLEEILFNALRKAYALGYVDSMELIPPPHLRAVPNEQRKH